MDLDPNQVPFQQPDPQPKPKKDTTHYNNPFIQTTPYNPNLTPPQQQQPHIFAGLTVYTAQDLQKLNQQQMKFLEDLMGKRVQHGYSGPVGRITNLYNIVNDEPTYVIQDERNNQEHNIRAVELRLIG